MFKSPSSVLELEVSVVLKSSLMNLSNMNNGLAYCFDKKKTMEQRTLRNVNNYLNTNIYSYLETTGGQSSNLYLKLVHFFNTSVN